MLVPESSVLSIVVIVDSKVNTTEGDDVQPVILKNSKAKRKSGSKANLSVISVTFVVFFFFGRRSHFQQQLSDFFFHLTQLVLLLL